MESLKIFLLGKYRINLQDIELRDLDSTKSQELLSYLLIHRKRVFTRDHLSCLLWPDTCATKSKRYLSKSMWYLQNSFESQLPQVKMPLFYTESEWVQFNPAIPIWLDIEVLEDAYALGELVENSDLTDLQLVQLEEAISLYQGDLLEGWYQDWCLNERERYRYIILNLLDILLAYYELNQNYEKGVRYGQLSLRFEPARERTHRRLIRLLYLSGQRTAALRQYDKCVTVLKNELGVAPGSQTKILYQQIRQDAFPVFTGSRKPLPENTSAHQLLRYLQGIHLSLSQAQYFIEQQIETVEALLTGNIIPS